MKKLKSELKNEEMALVLLKKLKQSQQCTREREVTSLGGGATLTATKVQPAAKDPKNLSRQNSTNDLLNSEKLVRPPQLFRNNIKIEMFHDHFTLSEKHLFSI